MRLFAAIELDVAVRQGLVRLQKALGLGDERGIRWIKPEQMHLTVKFLGEVPDEMAADVCAALKDVAEATEAFEIEVGGAGCFPERGPVRIIWAGVREPSGALAECQRGCEEVFAGMGFKQEHRAFSPHLTIARVKDSSLGSRIRAATARQGAFACGRQGVDELVMFESVRTREGTEYVAACRCELADADDVA